MISVYKHVLPFQLESGVTLPGYHLAYTTHGRLNETKDNVVWVFHALTANSDPAEWWDGLVGNEKLFDPSKYFIVCVNMPGSCYGSLGPLDINPESKEPYFHQFSFFTTRDMIRAYQPLRISLGIEKIHIGIGGSMGGQQLLEWAIEEPELFEHIVPLATNAFHSPWGIAFNASQRFCIETDPTWKEKNEKAGLEGMKVARGLALISYRHYETYWNTQSEVTTDKYDNFKSESYQHYQGEKLGKRFNAFSYYFLSRSMDSHNVGRGRESVEAALKKIRAKTIVIGITTDMLFPLREQQFLADVIPDAQFRSIHSSYGHDGFLLEYEKIENVITDFVEKKTAGSFHRKPISASNSNL
ncbi:MAG TPA: homoserine O-acetyltransferase [Chitinophagaceae bacterium]|nr:homoserine O-acetyltransferase [Chitinophagaceae bacterium]